MESIITSIDCPENNIIAEVNIFPNPYNPNSQELTIKINSNISQKADIKIYNISGQEIFSSEQELMSGINTITWNGQNRQGVNVKSGIYLCNIRAGKFHITEKIIVKF